MSASIVLAARCWIRQWSGSPKRHVASSILYRELVEVEALAIAADEAAMMLPPNPLDRLYTLVAKTANQAGEAREKSEDMLAQLSAHMAARAVRVGPEFTAAYDL